MKPYMFSAAFTAWIGALLLVGFSGGNWLAVVSISLISAVCVGTGYVVGVHVGSTRRNAELKAALTESLRKHRQAARQFNEQAAEIESLTARNDMLTGLIAKDPALVAELDDFHTWRADSDEHATQAIAIVHGDRT